MNQCADVEQLSEPSLSGLISDDNPTWNRAYPRFYGKAVDVVPRLIKNADQHLVNELFKRGLEKLRHGMKDKGTSPDPEIGKSWKKVQNFSGLLNMFAEIVRGLTIDYIRKHRRECQYDDQLACVADEMDAIPSSEWNSAFQMALNRIHIKHSELLRGRFINEMETAALMKLFGLSEDALNTAIFRAKAALRSVILQDPELCLILWPKKAKA